MHHQSSGRALVASQSAPPRVYVCMRRLERGERGSSLSTLLLHSNQHCSPRRNCRRNHTCRASEREASRHFRRPLPTLLLLPTRGVDIQTMHWLAKTRVDRKFQDRLLHHHRRCIICRIGLHFACVKQRAATDTSGCSVQVCVCMQNANAVPLTLNCTLHHISRLAHTS